MNEAERSRLARIITWLIAGVIVLVLIRVALWLLRATLSLIGALVVVVGLIIVGWLAMTLWDRMERGREPRR